MLLDLLLQAQRDEDEFVASLSQAERLIAGAENDWSPKDEIAHAAAWIERFVQRIKTSAGDVPSTPVEDINSGKRSDLRSPPSPVPGRGAGVLQRPSEQPCSPR